MLTAATTNCHSLIRQARARRIDALLAAQHLPFVPLKTGTNHADMSICRGVRQEAVRGGSGAYASHGGRCRCRQCMAGQ
jgi:hypothetical protein